MLSARSLAHPVKFWKGFAKLVSIYTYVYIVIGLVSLCIVRFLVGCKNPL